MIPTEKIIAWLRESAMGKEGLDRIRMREIADRLEQLTIENLNLKSMVEHLENSYQQLHEINARLNRYEELDMTPEDIEQTMLRFSSFLMEMTGGRMSKTNYTVQAMVDEANDYQQKELEEAEQKAYDLGVDSVLRNHFDIPWDEAADLRKNIDHLRKLLVAEKEGRLIVLPCKPGTTVYETIPKCNAQYYDCPYNGGRGGLRCETNKCDAYIAEVPFDPIFRDRIGKTLFLTRKKAEAKLAKMKEKNHA